MSTTTAKKADPGVTFPTRVDIDHDHRNRLVALLNQHLADLFDLRAQTKYAHWNVKGPNFYQLHLLFDSLAGKLEEHVDSVAERATALGGVATGTVRQAATRSRLPEFPSGVHKGMDVVTALADRFATAANSTRAAIDESEDLGDKSTADLFTEITDELDKSLYFLEAHIQG